jgi:molybdenum cofactor biosynthesis enzyme MoaA
MQEKNPDVAYQYVLQSHPRGSQEKTPITHSCNRPYNSVTIDMYTNCMLCVCDGWLPKPVGKITDFQRLEEIWDNPIAATIQKNVDDKKFTWCAVNHCGIKQQDNLETMYQLIFGIDDSCNLRCPSCRRETRMYESGPLYEEKLQAVKHTVELLNQFDSRIHITLACSGDPLASHIYRPLLHSYVGQPGHTFTLFTNGLLIKKQLDKTALVDKITEFRISIDAGSKDVYEKVRVGGNWETLLENFDYLEANNLSDMVLLVYVVQRNNYKDLENFVNLLEQYKFQGTLTQLDDWGTWNHAPVKNPDAWTIANGTYVEHNVLNPSHPEYHDCRDQVIQVKDHPRLSLAPRLQQLLDL